MCRAVHPGRPGRRERARRPHRRSVRRYASPSARSTGPAPRRPPSGAGISMVRSRPAHRAADEVHRGPEGRADWPTLRSSAEAYTEWRTRSNGNPRLTKMVRGWDRVIHFVTTDTGQGYTMRVRGPAAVRARDRATSGQPDVIVTGSERGLLRHVLGRSQPVGEVHERRDHVGRVTGGRDAHRRHLHGRLPRHLTRRDRRSPSVLRTSLRRALGLRTVVTTSTGLAFAALGVPGRRRTRDLCGRRLRLHPHHRRGSPRARRVRLLRRAQRHVPDGGGHSRST